MERAKVSHERVTIDCDIPPLPKKSELIPKPDQHQHDIALRGIDAKLAEAEQQLESLKAAIRGTNKAPDSGLEAGSAYEELVERKEKLLETYTELTEECRTLVDDQRRLRSEMAQLCSDEDDTASEDCYGRLSDEYEQKQRQVEDNAARRQSLAKDLQEMYQRLEALQANPQTLVPASKDVESGQLSALKTQREALKHSIEDLKAKRKALVASHKEREQSYKEQQRSIKATEQANYAQKKLREQEEKKRVQKQREEDQALSSCYQKDVSVCESVMRYLERVGAAKSGKSEEETEKTPPLTPVEPGMELIIDKKLREVQEGFNWFRNVQSKPKKKRERKPPAELPNLNLPVEMLAFLAAQGIKIPSNVGEATETLDALRAWRTHAEAAKPLLRSPKRSDAEERRTDDPPVHAMRARAFTEEISSNEEKRQHRGGRRGKRGRGYRYAREGRKGSELGSEDPTDSSYALS